MDDSTSQQQQSRLLSLPPEIRNRIYHYVLVSERDLVWHIGSRSRSPYTFLALLETCRQIDEEAGTTPYHYNRLCCKNEDEALKSVLSLRKHKLYAITAITVRPHGRDLGAIRFLPKLKKLQIMIDFDRLVASTMDRSDEAIARSLGKLDWLKGVDVVFLNGDALLEAEALANMADLPSQQPQSPFLTLPSELRNRIYHYALTSEADIVMSPSRSFPALLGTCRQIHEEARLIPYCHNRFCFSGYEQLYHGMRLLTEDQKEAINSLTIGILDDEWDCWKLVRQFPNLKSLKIKIAVAADVEDEYGLPSAAVIRRTLKNLKALRKLEVTVWDEPEVDGYICWPGYERYNRATVKMVIGERKALVAKNRNTPSADH
ncbi:hypothetical protein LTR37_016587 [Vermiconidia calcicola]|uniref:Uncharacterized protein n=1 Tax=Vermiconidia calcicola TaxID=1690605 RepID=A0ACC3MN92_9PEZI|nr:hypothetical protein LTR37_016587 [Vermiconidia calcicola]